MDFFTLDKAGYYKRFLKRVYSTKLSMMNKKEYKSEYFPDSFKGIAPVFLENDAYLLSNQMSYFGQKSHRYLKLSSTGDPSYYSNSMRGQILPLFHQTPRWLIDYLFYLLCLICGTPKNVKNDNLCYYSRPSLSPRLFLGLQDFVTRCPRNILARYSPIVKPQSII